MKQALRSIFCLLLVLSMLFVTGCKKPPTTDSTAAATTATTGNPESTNLPTDTEVEKEPLPENIAALDPSFVPVVRFAVTGDLHLRSASADMLSYSRLESVISSAYAFADSQSYNKLDGIFFTGDNTNNGKEDQQTYFFNYLKENVREGTVARAIMGNHEFYATGTYTESSFKKAPQNFMTYSGYDSVDSHQVIGGYHFIFLSMDKYTKAEYLFFSEEKLAWLKTELDKAVAEAPGKPIFLFQHEPPKGTMMGSGGGDKGLYELLCNYPQVVDFSGHSHVAMDNPRTIWQGDFTALSTASMAYLSIYVTTEDGTVVSTKASDMFGGYATGDIENAVRSGGMYYIVELDKDNKIRILIYNIFTGDLYGEPIMLDVSDPSKFTYTNERKQNAVKPVFENAAVTTISDNYKNPLISLTRAECKDVVQAYQIKIFKGDTEVNTLYRLAGANYGEAAPELLQFYLGQLKPETTYTLKISAISSWGLYSDPITAELTTGADSLEADILDIVFNTDGTATDAVTGEVLKIDGAPTVSYNSELCKNVATFDGDDAYAYQGIATWYEQIKQGFTLDMYICTAAKPAAGSAYPVSNLQTGGFGFEYHFTGKIIFDSKVGDLTVKPNTAVTVGTWYHITATFDGKTVSLYVNGELVKTADATGELVAPAMEAYYLCIGADSGAHQNTNYFKGSIASVKMYSKALTADQVAELNK